MTMLASFVKQLFGARSPDDIARARIDVWADWLNPLPSNDGAQVGRDPAYDDAFQAVKEEIGKVSGIDDTLIVRSCENLLRQTGKDLRLAAYYAFARVRQEGGAGLADGLELTAALVDRFGLALLPARDEAKRAALEWFANSRLIEQLDRHEAVSAADLERAMAALYLLMGRTGDWPEAARPNLQALVSRFGNSGEPVRAAANLSSAVQPAVAGVSPGGAPVAPVASVASARDALEQARMIARFLRDEDNGYLPSVRLVRCVRWDTLHEVPPADAQGRTRLAAPRGELRQQLKRLVLQKQWHELLERVEGAFMEGVNHLWLDLQYFQHVALDHAGAPYSGWRDILRADFALFLERLSGIERLAFSDGTPFADDATLEWIASHAVVRNLDEGEALAPLPVTGDDEDGAGSNWTEMEAQARDLAQAQGAEAALAWLDCLPGMRAERQRYLQRWVMARVADQAGRADAALHLLTELDAAETVQLARWEPSLTFEVKQHLLTLLKGALTRKDADKPALAQRIEKLRGELTVLDPARAIALLP